MQAATLALASALLLGPVPHTRPGPNDDPDAQIALGNPSRATTDPRHQTNLLVKHRYFVLSYNNETGTPNWVSWRLTKDDLGNAKRVPFHPDGSLPKGFKRITPKDYTGAGFDRGHMCPHSDRAHSHEASNATFMMSNVIPQAPAVNQKAWNELEIYCRKLAEQGKTLYVVCGPAGKGGVGLNGEVKFIGDGRVTVPAKCWKVILVLDGAGDPRGDVERVAKDTRLIAVIMPNSQEVGFDWARFRVPVKEVEELTGYRFFDQVPARIIEPLKQKADETRIPKSRPPRGGKNQEASHAR
jgi:endonuclease G